MLVWELLALSKAVEVGGRKPEESTVLDCVHPKKDPPLASLRSGWIDQRRWGHRGWCRTERCRWLCEQPWWGRVERRGDWKYFVGNTLIWSPLSSCSNRSSYRGLEGLWPLPEISSGTWKRLEPSGLEENLGHLANQLCQRISRQTRFWSSACCRSGTLPRVSECRSRTPRKTRSVVSFWPGWLWPRTGLWWSLRSGCTCSQPGNSTKGLLEWRTEKNAHTWKQCRCMLDAQHVFTSW